MFWFFYWVLISQGNCYVQPILSHVENSVFPNTLQAWEIVPSSTPPWISLIDSRRSFMAPKYIHTCVHIHMNKHTNTQTYTHDWLSIPFPAPQSIFPKRKRKRKIPDDPTCTTLTSVVVLESQKNLVKNWSQPELQKIRFYGLHNT